MEKHILNCLEFKLNQPSVLTFVHLILKTNSFSQEIALTASFLADLSLLSTDLQTTYLPSEIAIVAIFIGRQVHGACVSRLEFGSLKDSRRLL